MDILLVVMFCLLYNRFNGINWLVDRQLGYVRKYGSVREFFIQKNYPKNCLCTRQYTDNFGNLYIESRKEAPATKVRLLNHVNQSDDIYAVSWE